MGQSAVRNSMLLLGLLVSSANGSMATLSFTSQPGDWGGQGQTVNLTYDSTAVPAATVSALSINFHTLVRFVVNQNTASNTTATLWFGTDQLGIPLQPGMYTNAQRAQFASPGHPGMDIAFQNHGCNSVTGSFTITDVVLNQAGTNFQRFAVDFEQHCEGGNPSLIGTFTYNAIPEPSSLGVLAFLGLSRPARKRS